VRRVTARDALAATVPLLVDAAVRPCEAVQQGRVLRWDAGGGFALELTFQLLQRSTGTRSVPLVPHVRVVSRDLARWRRAAGLRPARGAVLDVPLGLLSPRARGLEWEIGESNRSYAARDVMRTLDEDVWPLVDVLSDPPSACVRLATELWGLLPTTPRDVAEPPVDYLLCWERADLVPTMVEAASGVPRFRRDLEGSQEREWVELAFRASTP
jgi:hypothetical protein